jgi:hypothetical protein
LDRRKAYEIERGASWAELMSADELSQAQKNIEGIETTYTSDTVTAADLSVKHESDAVSAGKNEIMETYADLISAEELS